MPAFRMRTSKFRHVYGKPFRKELCLENIRLTKNAHDGNFCAVNPKFIAVATESSGGGSFLVLPITTGGRVDINAPKISGHSGAVLDLKWNPFDNNVIASGADDATVKVWRVPPDGLATNLTEWQVDLHGHLRRVTYIDWHPTASNIVLSAGFDFKCFIWNVEMAEPVNVFNCHTDTIFSISWSREGSMFATTSKDKKIRVIDPRSTEIVAETEGHVGNKTSKVAFLEDHRLLTTGFSRRCDRQLAIWDIRNMKECQKMDQIDCSSGVIQPYYDPDIRVAFLAGKGDGNIRYYEITDDGNYFHYLNEYMSNSPQRGLGRMPKLGCDVSKCEIVRFYKIHGSKSLVEPISMIVPRKSEQFQEDIFPPTAGSIASLTADEWVSGQNREPILVSLQDGGVTNTPKVTTSRPVQRQDGALQTNPVITTYTAVSRQGRTNVPMRRANTIASATAPSNPPPPQEPASLKNIKRLSINEDIVTIDEPSPGLSQRRMMFEQTQNNNNNNNNKVNDSFSANQNSHYEKKIWSPITPQGSSTTNGITGSDSEHELLHFKQELPPFKQDIKPFSQDKSQFKPAVSPYKQQLPPFQQESTPFKRELPPSPKDKSHFKQDYSPMKKELPPFEQDFPPYQQELPPFKRDLPPSPKDRSHFQQPFRNDIPSYGQDRPYKHDTYPYRRDPSPVKQDPSLFKPPSPKDRSNFTQDFSPIRRESPPFQQDFKRELPPSPKDRTHFQNPFRQDMPSYQKDMPSYNQGMPSYGQDVAPYKQDFSAFKPPSPKDKSSFKPFQAQTPLHRPPSPKDRSHFKQEMTHYRKESPTFQQELPPFKRDLPPSPKDRSHFKQDVNQYRKESPTFQQDYTRDPPPVKRDMPPSPKDRSHFKQDVSQFRNAPTYSQNVSYQQDVAPYKQDLSPFKQDLSPIKQDLSPYKQDTSFNQELPPLKPNDLRGPEFSAPRPNDSCESDVVEWRTNAAYQRRNRPISSSSAPGDPSSYNSLAKLVIGEPTSPSQSNKIHVRKVWHMQPSPSSPSVPTDDRNGHSPQTDIELKKAYFRQQEEIRSLNEQLKVKEKRIHQLEDELERIKGNLADHSESNC